MKAVIICAAPEQNCGYIKECARGADLIICADGGLKHANACSLTPDVIIGDMDSYDGVFPKSVETVRLSTHKDDTDCIACIKWAILKGCAEITLAGALGGRTDHTLANLAALDYMANKGVQGKIVSGSEKISLLTVGKHRFCGCRGQRFSLLAFNCELCTVSYLNAEYPLERHTLSSSFPLGISNAFTDDYAEITVHNGKALLIT